jgi:hypothetical protein
VASQLKFISDRRKAVDFAENVQFVLGCFCCLRFGFPSGYGTEG